MAREEHGSEPIWFLSPLKTLKLFLSGVAIITSVGYLTNNFVLPAIANKKIAKERSLEEEENLEKYADIEIKYNRYVDSIAAAIKDNGLAGSVMDAFAAYSLMQEAGYMSLRYGFDYDLPVAELSNNYGISIVYGEGMSRNQSANLCRVLKALGYECGLVWGELTADKRQDEANFMMVYVVDGKDIYLLNPVDSSIYLRDIRGNYHSIYRDQESVFYPIKDADIQAGYSRDNKAFYHNFSDDYSSYLNFKTPFLESLEKAKKKRINFYRYERDTLEKLEEDLIDEIDESLLSNQEVLVSADAKKLSL